MNSFETDSERIPCSLLRG